MKTAIFCLILLSLSTTTASAAIYKSVDENGHVTYSSSPIKGTKNKKIVLEPLPTVPPPSTSRQSSSSSTSSEKNFPRVSNSKQKQMDNKRQQILKQELKTEQKLLKEAKQQLEAAKANPRVYRTADGQTRRNYALYQKEIEKAQAKVEQHQANVDALKTELSR